jgi:hypothetical protein
MAIDGRQADPLATTAKLGVDILRATEPGETFEGRGQHLRLSCAADPGTPNRL